MPIWKDVELSATALERLASETISATKVWRTGASNAVTQPSTSAKRYTCQSSICPVSVRTPSASASVPCSACVTQQHAAPVEAVRDVAGDGQQEERRTELQRHHEAHRGRVVVGELREDDPVLRGALHPRADVRHQRARSPQAIVETA